MASAKVIIAVSILLIVLLIVGIVGGYLIYKYFFEKSGGPVNNCLFNPTATGCSPLIEIVPSYYPQSVGSYCKYQVNILGSGAILNQSIQTDFSQSNIQNMTLQNQDINNPLQQFFLYAIDYDENSDSYVYVISTTQTTTAGQDLFMAIDINNPSVCVVVLNYAPASDNDAKGYFWLIKAIKQGQTDNYLYTISPYAYPCYKLTGGSYKMIKNLYTVNFALTPTDENNFSQYWNIKIVPNTCQSK